MWPCSEIHYDLTPEGTATGEMVNADLPEVIEIWNLVFIQYNRRSDGSLEELASKHVDTGMGFERLCAVLQGKTSNYDTDVFMPLIERLAALSTRAYEGEDAIAMRVISDHIRTLAIAISDGVLPSNDGRGMCCGDCSDGRFGTDEPWVLNSRFYVSSFRHWRSNWEDFSGTGESA